MKSFVCSLLLGALVAGEPPSYRPTRFREDTTDVQDAPYPAAGFQPRRKFELPSRQQFNPPARQEFSPQNPPSTSYGTPDNSYSAPFNVHTAPQNEYGFPTATSKSTEKDNENDDSLTVEAIAKVSEEQQGKAKPKDNKENLESAKNDAEVVSNKGVYYVLLPGSQLQRVQFVTENNPNKMAYTARLQYKNEDRAPVYFYTTAPQAQVQQYQYQANAAYAFPPVPQNQQTQAYPLPEVPQNQLGLSYAVLPPRQNEYGLPVVSQNQPSPYSVPSMTANQFGPIYAVPSETLQNQYALPLLSQSQNQPSPTYSVASVNVPAVSQNRQISSNEAAVAQNQGSEYDVPSPQSKQSQSDAETSVEQNRLGSAYAFASTSKNQYPSTSMAQFETNQAVPSTVQVQPETQYGVPQRSNIQSNGRYRTW